MKETIYRMRVHKRGESELYMTSLFDSIEDLLEAAHVFSLDQSLSLDFDIGQCEFKDVTDVL